MIKVGILGAGGMGGVHGRQYSAMNDVELGFFEIDSGRAEAYIGKSPRAHRYASVEELIQKCDIVDICLPLHLHYDFGLKVIAAGKALMMEKPITRTLEEGAKLIEAADKAGVPFMVAHVLRFFPEFAKAHKLIREGAIGRPAAARLRRGGRAPMGADSWFMDHTRSGGVLIDLAIHDFDWIRWTLGEVKHLYSRSVGAATDQGPDYALTTLTLETGVVAHTESTWMDPSGFRSTFEVCGSEGMLSFDSRHTLSLRTSQEGKTTVAEAPLVTTDDPYYQELRSFVNSVQQGTPIAVSGTEGLKALALGLAARESAKTGKTVRPVGI